MDMLTKVNHLLLVLTILNAISYGKADVGFVVMTNNIDDTTVEVCSEYNPDFAPYPEELVPSTSGSHVVDIYPINGCDQPEKTEQYQGKVVIVKRQKNCTFSQRALIVQKSHGKGVIVVSETGLLTPAASNQSEYDQFNITVSLISEESHDKLKVMIQKYGDSDVFIRFYSLEMPLWNFNEIIMWTLAVVTCAIGAWSQGSAYFRGLSRRRTVLNDADDQNDGRSTAGNRKKSGEEITVLHAVIFLVMCSGSLLLMYFFYQYMVYVIIVIFCIASCFATYDFFAELLRKLACYTRYRIPANNLPILRSRPPILSIVLLLCSAGVAVFWAVQRNEPYAWILQDFLGFMFCVNMIKQIRLPSFKISSLLLVLFFVYDVFFVFITPLFTKNKESIMVNIATGGGKSDEQIPMLFKLPRLGYSPYQKCAASGYSLLGYGDVILPGLHVGFCAVWDIKISNTVRRHPYFISGIIGYGVGLILTFVGMYFMARGQPALLYLTPCCLLSTLLVALKRKELASMWRGKYLKNETGSAVDEEERGSFLNDANESP